MRHLLLTLTLCLPLTGCQCGGGVEVRNPPLDPTDGKSPSTTTQTEEPKPACCQKATPEAVNGCLPNGEGKWVRVKCECGGCGCETGPCACDAERCWTGCRMWCKGRK